MKHRILALLFSLLAPLAYAAETVQTSPPPYYTEWVIGLSLAQVNYDAALVDRDFYAAAASLGYRFNVMDSENLFVIPEFRVGYSIGADNVEADHDPDTQNMITYDGFWNVAIRALFQASNGIYGFIAPGYGRFNHFYSNTPDSFERPDLGDDRSFGLGLGGGYRFKNNVGLELTLDNYDSQSLLSLGARFHF